MSISSILNSGLSALLANQAALRTTSTNISNVNTPDYVRRIVNFQSQTTDGALGGVEIGSVQRAVDQFLNTERLGAASTGGQTDAASRFLDQLQKAMGGVSDGRDPASRAADLTAGLAQLSTDPASAAMQADFVQKLKDFAQGISDLGSKVQDLRAQADAEIGSAVGRINDLTTRIADLNLPIQQAVIAGDNASILLDQRDAAVRELAGLIDIRVETGSSGRMSVTTSNGYTLVSDSASQATHINADAVSANTVFQGLTIERHNASTGELIGQPEGFEKYVTGGTLRGLLDLRDKTLPDVAQQIGALAAGAAEAFNAAANASSAWPAPTSLTGRDTGLLASDALGFTGKTTVAVVDAQGKLVRKVDVDFSAGTLSVDGGAATAFTNTIGGFTSSLNMALGGTGTASFTNGVMSLSATGSNGIAVQQDATTPSDRAGRGFAHTFGLNDIFSSSVPTSFKTGLVSSDAHGFAAGQQVQFGLRDASGAITKQFTYTVSGTTIADMVSGLNAAAGTSGSFALAADGSMAFTPAGGSAQRLEIQSDTTERGTTGVSLTEMFGIGQRYQMAQATGLSVNAAIAASPSKLPRAQLDLSSTAAIGDVVLASADNKGVLALQAAGASINFSAAAGVSARTTSLADFAASLVASIGQRSAAATSAAGDAKSLKTEVETRAVAHEGVSLDEELANMMKFQQAYNAGARLITTAQKLYDELLNMVK